MVRKTSLSGRNRGCFAHPLSRSCPISQLTAWRFFVKHCAHSIGSLHRDSWRAGSTSGSNISRRFTAFINFTICSFHIVAVAMTLPEVFQIIQLVAQAAYFAQKMSYLRRGVGYGLLLNRKYRSRAKSTVSARNNSIRSYTKGLLCAL